MRHKVSRRRFLAAACVGAAVSARKRAYSRESSPKLAVLGGKAVRNQPFPSWPVIGDNDEKAWLDVLRSRSWNRLGGTRVDQFEKSWAGQLGAGHCVATASGTSALFTALNALGSRCEALIDQTAHRP